MTATRSRAVNTEPELGFTIGGTAKAEPIPPTRTFELATAGSIYRITAYISGVS